jgi:hypothetical protein
MTPEGLRLTDGAYDLCRIQRVGVELVGGRHAIEHRQHALDRRSLPLRVARDERALLALELDAQRIARQPALYARAAHLGARSNLRLFSGPPERDEAGRYCQPLFAELQCYVEVEQRVGRDGGLQLDVIQRGYPSRNLNPPVSFVSPGRAQRTKPAVSRL